MPSVTRQTIFGTFLIYTIFLLFFSAFENLSASDSLAVQESPKKIRLVMAELEHTYSFRLAAVMYSDAFARLGYSFQLLALPSERALIEANAGRVDGDAGRIAFDSSLVNRYPNLIRVPEVVIVLNYNAYMVDSTVKFNSWADIGSSHYRVCYTRGAKLIEARIKALGRDTSWIGIRDLDQGLELVKRNRADVLIGVESSMREILMQPIHRDIVVYNAGVLETGNIYPYLNKKYNFLVPRLAEVLREMKMDGSFKRHVAAVHKEIMQKK